MNMILSAARFAVAAHAGQLREVSGDPYHFHLGRVAAVASTLTLENDDIDTDEELVAAAWLHDTLEDTKTKREDLSVNFGGLVASDVDSLTNRFTSKAYPGLNRVVRKEREIERLAQQPKRARALKLIDRMDNLRDIDPAGDFARKHAVESESLVLICKADLPKLSNRLAAEIDKLLKRHTAAVAAARKPLYDPDLVEIINDVKDEQHPDCWSRCGQTEVLAITRELQERRGASTRLALAMEALGQPGYIPVLKDNGGLSAHRFVVNVAKAALRGDPEFEQFWRTDRPKT